MGPMWAAHLGPTAVLLIRATKWGPDGLARFDLGGPGGLAQLGPWGGGGGGYL